MPLGFRKEDLVMKIFWWQGGVHIEPETHEERKTLGVLFKNIKTVEQVNTALVGGLYRNNQESIVNVNNS